MSVRILAGSGRMPRGSGVRYIPVFFSVPWLKPHLQTPRTLSATGVPCHNPSPVGVQGAPGVRFGHSRAPGPQCGRCHVTTATRHPASRPLAAKDPPAATQRPIGPLGGDWPSQGVGFGHRPLQACRLAIARYERESLALRMLPRWPLECTCKCILPYPNHTAFYWLRRV